MMKKNDWAIEQEDYDREKREVTINNVVYIVDDKTACLSHGIALLIDAIDDLNDELANRQ